MKARLIHHSESATTRWVARVSGATLSNRHALNAPQVSRGASWRRAAIFAVKLIHSLIFLSVAVSILHIFYAGITNRIS